MAVRLIDAGILQDNLTDIYGDGNRLVYLKDVLGLIDEQPTLTPPNEALTLEQLREMDGQPVWVDDEKIWALLQVWDDDNIDIVFPMPRGCFHAKSVLGKKIYRRPPEGEEDT